MAEMDRNELVRAMVDAFRELSEVHGMFGGGSAMGAGGGGGGRSSVDDSRPSNARTRETSAIEEHIRAVENDINARKREARHLDELNKILETEEAARSGLIFSIDEETKAKLNARKVEEALNSSSNNLKRAFQSLGDALMNPEQGFKKYEDGLSKGGEALSGFTSKMGPSGKALGIAIEQLTKLNLAIVRQTQSILDSADGLAKAGAAGELTSKQIRELAHQAGYTSKNMEGLFKASKSLGTDILSLGTTVNDGTKAFTKLAERNDDVLAGFRRLGFSQQEFTAAQADSVKLLNQQGKFIIKDMRDAEKLRSITYQYAENLSVLSSLTGESIEQSKKQQEAAQSAFNVQMKLASLAVEEKDLKEKLKTSGGEEAESIKARLKAIEGETFFANTVLPQLKSQLDEKTFKGAQDIFASGTMSTSEAAALNNLLQGRAIQLFQQSKEVLTGESDEAKRSQAEYLASIRSQISTGAEQQVRLGGRLGQFAGGQEGAEALGLGAMTTRQLGLSGGKTQEELSNEIFKQLKAIGETKQGRGAVGEDRAQRTRAFIETAERRIQIFVDSAVGALNPFTAGLSAGTLALVGLNAAALAAAGSLAMLALGNKFGIPGAASAAGTLGKIGKVAGIAGVGGLAATAVGAGSDYLSEKAAKSGHTEVAKGIDVAGTTASGAALGATVGSIFPGIGTGIGAGVGALLGGGYGLYKNYFGDESSQGKKEGEPPPPKGSAPGAATGGILSGPKTGFPAILHGTEAVIPLDGKKIPIEFSYDNLTSTSEDIENRELQKKNVKGVDDNNLYLQKLISTVASLDKTLKKQIEDEEDKEFEKATGADGKKNDKAKDESKPTSQPQPQPAPKPVAETQPETPSILDRIRRGVGEMIPSWMKPSEETPPSTTPPTTADQTTPTPIKTSKPFTGNQKEFTSTLYNSILEEAKKQGLPNPEVIAKLGTAQSALETGYGKSLAGGQNYFGIKDFSGKGRNIQSTKEEIDGKLVEVRDAFRQYKNREESVADWVSLISKSKKYSKVLEAKTPEEAARLVKEGGYATDSAYVQKLTKIMERMSVDDGNTQTVTKTPLPTTDTLSLQTPVPEQYPGAATGGILEGSKDGYPVELHGKEAVIPLNDKPDNIRKHLAWIEENFAVTKNIGRNVGDKVVEKTGIENPIASAMTGKLGSRVTSELIKRLIPELGLIEKVGSIAGKVGDVSDIASSDSNAMDKIIDLVKLHPKVKAITFAYEFLKPYLDKTNVTTDAKKPASDLPKPDNITTDVKQPIPELPKPDNVITDATSPITDLLKPYLDRSNITTDVKQPIPELPKPDLTPPEKTNDLLPQTNTITSAPAVTTIDPVEEQARMTEMLAEMLSSKFDAMIDRLNDANGIAEQQLRALRT